MKLSESRLIRNLDRFATAALIFYVIFILVKVFSISAPALSKSVKGYEMYGVQVKVPANENTNASLEDWFKKKVIVNKTNLGMVEVRFKTYSQLFSFSAIIFQIAQYFQWICIGLLALGTKCFFASLRKDEVFTARNGRMIIAMGFLLMLLPLLGWLAQELFLNCIAILNLNDSGYVLNNGRKFFDSTTLVGLVVIALGLAFKVGVQIKQENEAFV